MSSRFLWVAAITRTSALTLALLPTFSKVLADLLHELEHGRGVVLMRGFQVEPAPPGRLKNAHAQLLRCIHNLVAKAISGAGCVRPPSDGDAIEDYALAENACVSLPDIRRRLGVI